MRRSFVAFGAALLLSLAALVVSGVRNVEAEGAAPPAGLNFVVLPRPEALPPLHFADAAGRPLDLADFRGKLVLLNIWATWCIGCREEIGALNHLEAMLGGKKFQVVAVAIDRGGAPAVRSFLSEVNARALKIYIDPSLGVPEKLGVFGIPTSFLVNAKGQEIGKIVGPAEWDQPAIVDWLKSYLPAGGAAPKVKILNKETRADRQRSRAFG